VTVCQIFWNDGGELVCIATDESFFILRYNAESVDKLKDQPDAMTEDGIEEAFDVSRWFDDFTWLIQQTLVVTVA